jgi:hypothetical protein
MIRQELHTIINLIEIIESSDIFISFPIENGETFCWSNEHEGFKILVEIKILLNKMENVIILENSGYKINHQNKNGTLYTSKGIITFVYPIN